MAKQPKDPRPHRTALSKAVKGLRFKWCHWNLRADEIAAREDEWEDRKTWVGGIWALREGEQNQRQEARAAYIKLYRPIQTLDGLDPSPRRVAFCELISGFRVFAANLRAG